jgi:Rad3-related DNA helicase
MSIGICLVEYGQEDETMEVTLKAIKINIFNENQKQLTCIRYIICFYFNNCKKCSQIVLNYREGTN